jgi:putative tryptophan/tyrosine transport system substrate-binding protein
MKRREFIALLGDAAAAPLCLWTLPAHTQQAIHPRKIGVLWHAASAEEEAVYLTALR